MYVLMIEMLGKPNKTVRENQHARPITMSMHGTCVSFVFLFGFGVRRNTCCILLGFVSYSVYIDSDV